MLMICLLIRQPQGGHAKKDIINPHQDIWGPVDPGSV